MDFGKRAPPQRRRLERRNAIRDIDYEPAATAVEDDSEQDHYDQPPPSASRSWSEGGGGFRSWFGPRSHSSPSPTSSFSSSSTKLYASKTSFRIDGELKDEVDVICRSLGLSGPEDFAIPAAMWEASKGLGSKSPSSALDSDLSGGHARSMSGSDEEEPNHGGDGGVAGQEEADVQLNSISPSTTALHPILPGTILSASNNTSSSPPQFPSPLSPQFPGPSGVTKGIRGSRPAALSPPLPPPPAVAFPVPHQIENSNNVVSVSLRSAPPEDQGSASSSNSSGFVIRGKETVKTADKEDSQARERLDVVAISRELSQKLSTAERANVVGNGSSRRTREGGGSNSRRVRRNITGWIQGRELGRGSFGTVFEAISDDGFFFALKEVSLLDQGPNAQQCVEQLEREITLLSNFEHENIVQYLGTKKGEAKLYIFLELVTQGSLAALYQKYQLQDSQVSAYTRQILHGLQYLHERNIVHRDIKCSNILVDASGSVKLADFGLAKETTKFNMLKSCQGSVYWMAPEVVNPRQTYGPAADIWSLGCTVLEMLTQKLPYPDMEWMQALYKIGKGQMPVIPDSLSADARDFISKCIKVVPEDRPTASMLLDHPFVKTQLLNSTSSV